MNALLVWGIAYVVPALCADTFITFFPERKTLLHRRNAEVMHAMLIISGLATQYVLYRTEDPFSWNLNFSIFLYVLGVLLAFGLIGKLGVWYGFSALLQEFAMLSIAFFLFSFFPLAVVILLVVPIFVISHPLRAKHWVIRALIISFWGISSVSLFYLLHNIWIVAAVHTVLGALFIRRGILYPRRFRMGKRLRTAGR